MQEYGAFFKKLLPEETRIGSGLSFAVVTGERLLENIQPLSEIVATIATDGFGGGKLMSAERMEDRLLQEGNLIIALDEGLHAVGFQMQTIFHGGHEDFMYYSRVVRKDQQGKGIGGKLLRTSIDVHQPTVITARSQNPAEMSSFIKEMKQLGINDIYPFNLRYDFNQRAEDALSLLVAKLGYQHKTDLKTGVCKQAYSEGRLGDYEIRIDHPRIAKIEEALVNFGLDRQNGDAIFYLAFNQLSE